jgi:dextranase
MSGIEIRPGAARYLLGERVRIVVDSEGAGEGALRLRAPGRELLSREVSFPAGRSEIDIGELPPGGYAASLAGARTAFDVSRFPDEFVRNGFLSDFSSADEGDEAGAESLARYHITHVQFYDWMYRHHELLPPAEEFTDPMGRSLSLRAVKSKARACRERGMRPMGYAAVYGSEAEWFSARPETMLYREDGSMIVAGGLFGIADVSPGSAWSGRFVGQLKEAAREAGFDGFHLDQYGFPKAAFDSAGRRVELAECFAPLIDAAKGAMKEAAGAEQAGAEPAEAGSIFFNCVNAWPLEAVAASAEDATYVEVWDPNSEYRDLAELVRRMRALAPGKTAILAAYIRPFKDPLVGEAERENSALLARAVISANGGDHLLLGERSGILRVPYYADYARCRESFAAVLADWQDFIVRYRDLLFASELEDVTKTWMGGINEEIRASGPPTSIDYRAGTIGLSASRGPLGLTISLVNLLGLTDSRWNEPKPDPAPAGELTFDILLPGAAPAGFRASPDEEGGEERPVALEKVAHSQGTALRCRVPCPKRWSLLHIPYKD